MSYNYFLDKKSLYFDNYQELIEYRQEFNQNLEKYIQVAIKEAQNVIADLFDGIIKGGLPIRTYNALKEKYKSIGIILGNYIDMNKDEIKKIIQFGDRYYYPPD